MREFSGQRNNVWKTNKPINEEIDGNKKKINFLRTSLDQTISFLPEKDNSSQRRLTGGEKVR